MKDAGNLIENEISGCMIIYRIGIKKIRVG